MAKVVNRHERLWFNSHASSNRRGRLDYFRSRPKIRSAELDDVNEKVGAAEIDCSEQSISTARASDIKKILDEKVIGQEPAKQSLSILISMFLHWNPSSAALNPPPNGIILGPTGSGKTFSIKVASSALNIPVHVFDATNLVPEGARTGSSISELRAEISRQSASKVIVFIDEIDKLAADEKDNNAYWKSDIQRSLLKFIETQYVDTSSEEPRALFIMGGAFSGIERVRRLRSPETQRMLSRSKRTNDVVAEDIKNYGMIPEFVSRLPAIIQYTGLDESALLDILRHPVSSPLAIWTNHFAEIGKNLIVSDEFLIEISKRAVALQIGARGLQQMLFTPMSKFAYENEDSEQSDLYVDLRHLDEGKSL